MNNMEFGILIALIGGVIAVFWPDFGSSSTSQDDDQFDALDQMGLRNIKLEDYVSLCVSLISQDNLKTLAQNRERLRYKDEYGNIEDKRWVDHVEKFASKNLFSKKYENLQSDLSYYNYWHEASGGITSFIVSKIDQKLDSQPNHSQDGVPIDPIKYEHYVAKKLRDLGWDARVTSASGDQGADIVATMNGVKLVVQCKRYSSPIGNSAVQEVIAAMKYYHAGKGAVVSNQSFTKSARMLASVSGVDLLHHDNLNEC